MMTDPRTENIVQCELLEMQVEVSNKGLREQSEKELYAPDLAKKM